MNRVLNLVFIVFVLLAAFPAAECRAGEDIVLGMSGDFSGPARHLGIELYRGAALYLDHVNRLGGVHGRKVLLEALDDGYAPDPAIANTVKLVERHRAFALFNYVGTPTTTRILPLLKRYDPEHIVLLCPMTGADFLRRPPYDRYVYNLRASYADETKALVDRLVEAGRKRISILYQVDSYGRSAWVGVRRALAAHGLSIASEASYRRGSGIDADMSSQVDVIARARPDAVVAAGTPEAVTAFVRTARDRGLSAPIAALSFSAARDVLALLKDSGPGDYTKGFIGVLVTPCHEDAALPAVREFRRLMQENPPPLPPGVESYIAPPFSPVAFEGFLNAKLVVEALRRLGPEPRRSGLPRALKDTGPFDLGVGKPLRFPEDGNQAMEDVYFVFMDKGELKALHDFGRLLP